MPLKDTVRGWLNQPFESELRPGVAVTDGAVESYLSPKSTEPTLPALSVQVPKTVAAASSGPEYVFDAAHESMPEIASVPEKDTVSAWLYQPFASGWRAGLAATEGPLASYLSPNVEATLRLPALSVQVPLTEALPVSGPEYEVCVHVSTPEVASAPEKPTETAWLYQPFASGLRPAVPVAVGGVESYLIGKETVPRLPALSRHDPVTEALPLSGPS